MLEKMAQDCYPWGHNASLAHDTCTYFVLSARCPGMGRPF